MPQPQDYVGVAQEFERAAAQAVPVTHQVRVVSRKVDLTPALGAALSGYSVSVLGRRSLGWLGRLWGLVILADDGQGHRWALLALDLHAGSRRIAEMVAKACAPYGLSIERVFVASAHSHAAPGGIYGSRFYDDNTCSPGIVGVNEAYLDLASDRITDAIEELDAELAAAPPAAGLGYGETRVWAVIWQRAMAAHAANAEGAAALAQMDEPTVAATAHATALRFAPQAEVDHVAATYADPRFLAVDPRVRALVWHMGDRRAAVVFVGVTPTLFGGHVRVANADVFGMAARLAERALGNNIDVAVVGAGQGDTFVVSGWTCGGAQADQELATFTRLRGQPFLKIGTPLEWKNAKKLHRMAAIQAQKLADAIVAAVEAAEPSYGAFPAAIAFDESVMAGAAEPAVSERGALGDGMLHGNDLEKGPTVIADWCPPLQSDWPDRYGRGIIRGPGGAPDPVQDPKRVADVAQALFAHVCAPGAFSPWCTSRLVTFTGAGGPLRLLGVPFEPTTMAAAALEDQLVEQGGGRTVVACLAGDYISYLTTAPEYDVQQYEGGSTWFGRNTLAWVQGQTTILFNGGAAPAHSTWFAATPMKTMIDKPQLPRAPVADYTECVEVERLGELWHFTGVWHADRVKAVAPPSGAVALRLVDALTGEVLTTDLDGQILLRREGYTPGAAVWRWSAVLPREAAWVGRSVRAEPMQGLPGFSAQGPHSVSNPLP